MMKFCILSALLLSLLAIHSAFGHTNYQTMIPNGANVAGHPALGHPDVVVGGAALNEFGEAFKSAGYNWSKSLCEADSDNDGQSNGLELGDPECVWIKGATPARTTDISNPTLASSTTSAASGSSGSVGGTTTSSSSRQSIAVLLSSIFAVGVFVVLM